MHVHFLPASHVSATTPCIMCVHVAVAASNVAVAVAAT